MHAAEELKREGLTVVEAVQLDVTNDTSIKGTRRLIGEKTDVLDVLINNAGITGVQLHEDGTFLPQTAIDITVEVYKEVYETNLYGVIRVTLAFLDLLKKSAEPGIVMVSCSQGSIILYSDPYYKYYNHKGSIYLSSKSGFKYVYGQYCL